MKITKLNADSSWLWEIEGVKILVDPWFSESQVDFHPLFSKQFHLDPQPKTEDLERPDFIFISHPFSDHCDRSTLIQMDPTIPMVCLPGIAKKIRKWRHFQTFLTLEEAPFSIEKISITSFLDLVHHAYHVKDSVTSMVYAPHGTTKIRQGFSCDVLIATMTSYHLPFYLGGTVNLGLEKALELAKKLSAKTIISTHDEQKKQQGLVARLSKRNYLTSNQFRTIDVADSFEF